MLQPELLHYCFKGSEKGYESGCAGGYDDWVCCSSYNPCMEGEGDCDGEWECLGRLICGDDNCGSSMAWGMDCCVPP